MSTAALITQAVSSFARTAALCYGANLRQDTILKVGGVFALSTLAQKFSGQLDFQDSTGWFFPKYVQALTYASASYILTGSDRLTGLAMSINLLSSCIIGPEVATRIQRWNADARGIAHSLIHGATLGILARAAGYDNKVALAGSVSFALAHRTEEGLHSLVNATSLIPSLKKCLSIAATGSVYYATGFYLARRFR